MASDNTKDGLIAGALLGFFFNALKQAGEMEGGTREEFSLQEALGSTLKGAGIGGGIGLILDAVEEDESGYQRFQETQYLRQALRSYDPKDTTEMDFLNRKKEEICDHLLEEFNGMAYKPEVSGSMGKGTEVLGSFDLDLVIPFRRGNFKNLQDMYDHTFEVLEDMAASDPEITEVRRQGRSIGLICSAHDYELKIDIVPGVERKNYPVDKELTLYERPKDWLSDSSHVKTNIHKHREVMDGSPSKKLVARLFKIWKDNFGVEVKGFEIELLVDAAFRTFGEQLPSTLFGKLFFTARFILERIDDIDLRDPATPSKKILTDPNRREAIKERIADMVNDVAQDRTQLGKYFPECSMG
jgi:hypothetical protein